MKRIVAAGLFLAMCASSALSGEVYGTITENNKPVPAGVKVQISVSGKDYEGSTDKFGSYRIVVHEKGKGTITVSMNQGTASAGLYSYDKATRYDWIVEATDGKVALRRK